MRIISQQYTSIPITINIRSKAYQCATPRDQPHDYQQPASVRYLSRLNHLLAYSFHSIICSRNHLVVYMQGEYIQSPLMLSVEEIW